MYVCVCVYMRMRMHAYTMYVWHVVHVSQLSLQFGNSCCCTPQLLRLHRAFGSLNFILCGSWNLSLLKMSRSSGIWFPCFNHLDSQGCSLIYFIHYIMAHRGIVPSWLAVVVELSRRELGSLVLLIPLFGCAATGKKNAKANFAQPNPNKLPAIQSLGWCQ